MNVDAIKDVCHLLAHDHRAELAVISYKHQLLHTKH